MPQANTRVCTCFLTLPHTVAPHQHWLFFYDHNKRLLNQIITANTTQWRKRSEEEGKQWVTKSLGCETQFVERWEDTVYSEWSVFGCVLCIHRTTTQQCSGPNRNLLSVSTATIWPLPAQQIEAIDLLRIKTNYVWSPTQMGTEGEERKGLQRGEISMLKVHFRLWH